MAFGPIYQDPAQPEITDLGREQQLQLLNSQQTYPRVQSNPWEEGAQSQSYAQPQQTPEQQLRPPVISMDELRALPEKEKDYPGQGQGIDWGALGYKKNASQKELADLYAGKDPSIDVIGAGAGSGQIYGYDPYFAKRMGLEQPAQYQDAEDYIHHSGPYQGLNPDEALRMHHAYQSTGNRPDVQQIRQPDSKEGFYSQHPKYKPYKNASGFTGGIHGEPAGEHEGSPFNAPIDPAIQQLVEEKENAARIIKNDPTLTPQAKRYGLAVLNQQLRQIDPSGRYSSGARALRGSTPPIEKQMANMLRPLNAFGQIAGKGEKVHTLAAMDAKGTWHFHNVDHKEELSAAHQQQQMQLQMRKEQEARDKEEMKEIHSSYEKASHKVIGTHKDPNNPALVVNDYPEHDDIVEGLKKQFGESRVLKHFPHWAPASAAQTNKALSDLGFQGFQPPQPPSAQSPLEDLRRRGVPVIVPGEPTAAQQELEQRRNRKVQFQRELMGQP